ncbi:hypothetical protein MSAN_01555600 [Mycena sanguinolenta]|uniref:Uncharacterized protein n=1 Tax=Mycena sanguinolenta TaxID=230812 RepID=A0A8H6Y2Z7_9AGAR|nr:hypothetical protein MSAN_01555600 [Mycena sanguinolenta]
MKVAVAILPLFFSFTLASFIVDQVTEAALTCEPVLLQWQGGPLGHCIVATDGSLIEDLVTFTTGTSFHWTVNVAAGTVVAAQVTDSTGAVATGNNFTVGQGTTDCTSNQGQSANSGSISPTTVGISSSQTTAPITTIATSNIQLPSSSGFGTITDSASYVLAPSISPATVGVTHSSSSFQTTAATTSTSNIQSPSSSVAGTITDSSSHKSRVGMAFAILIPSLIVLVVLGLFFLRRRRRRREALPALEAQPPPPHWFEKPSYQGASFAFVAEAANREVDTQPVPKVSTNPTATRSIAVNSDPTPPPSAPEKPSSYNGTSANFGGTTEQGDVPRQRPTLNIVPAANPNMDLMTSRTPGTEFLSATALPSHIPYGNTPVTSSDRSSKYVETLHSRIEALVAENARLTELATPQVDLPPPAYT